MSRHRRAIDEARAVERLPPFRRASSRASAPRARMGRSRRIAIAVLSLAVLGVLGTTTAFWLQGYRAYVVHTGSMSPTYRPGDLVVDGPADRDALRPGQVITFRHSDLTTDLVTHRVTAVTASGISTKGDANRTADAWTIRPDQVKGHVLFGLHGLGYLMVYLRQPSGIGSIATVTIAILLLWGTFFRPAAPSRRPDAARRRRQNLFQSAPIRPRRLSGSR